MLLGQALLDKVFPEAKDSPRFCMNFNLYESLDFAGIYGDIFLKVSVILWKFWKVVL